ncbi:hypothetical protein [Streptomyces sp. NPDC058045]|uniref:hypothetical protein n=1 Tax=Streptomyces sp. NPDC058045 TaxID=3346311 RepID=UPI0036EAEAD1
MNLVELVENAGPLELAASGLGCLDRCAPLLGGEEELRPLWTSLAEGGADWTARLAEARTALLAAVPAEAPQAAVDAARTMLAGAPASLEGAAGDGELAEWAGGCSVAVLEVHRVLDRVGGSGPVAEWRAGRTEGMPMLAAAELRRQQQILRLLAEQGTAGLRPALALTVEGRRVLRAALSRRARTRP